MFLYSVFILPEALTPERKAELMDANEATQESEAHNNNDDEDHEQGHMDAINKRFNFFKKLAILAPYRDAETGKRDYRLTILATAFTIYRIAGLYTNDVGW